MAALFGATTTQTEDSNTTSIDIFHPGSPAVDDLLWATLTVDGRRAIVVPAGWTTVELSHDSADTTGLSAWVGYRLYQAGDPTFWTWVCTGPETLIGTMSSITGHDVADVVDVSALGVDDSSTRVCPDVTTTVPETLLMRSWGQDECNAPATAPAGVTEAWDLCAGDGSPFCGSAGGHEVQVLAGATGTAVWTGVLGSRWLSFTVAIKPAAVEAVGVGGSSLGEMAAFVTEWRGDGFLGL